MQTDVQDQDSPEYREMQDMIATNQRELDAKTRRLGEERLQFLKSQGAEDWSPEYTPDTLRARTANRSPVAANPSLTGVGVVGRGIKTLVATGGGAK